VMLSALEVRFSLLSHDGALYKSIPLPLPFYGTRIIPSLRDVDYRPIIQEYAS